MKKTLIIVDDNKVDRNVLKANLKNQYSVLEAENGEQLLGILEKEYEKVSAILLDVIMPVMDGFEALRKIRSSNEFMDIPVIITTVENNMEARQKAIEYGANGYLSKPYNPDLIKKSLENVISYHENALLVKTLSRDKLTGLMSHELFEEEGDKLIKSHEPGYYTLSCIDVDRFKVINDQYGMQIGDQVLKHIADNLKLFNKGIEGLSCRFTADRFAILYPTTLADTAVIEDSHRHAQNPPCIKHPIRLSVGRYIINDPTISMVMAYERATVAEESIKDRYDIFIATYDEAMRTRILHEQHIVNEMSEALQKGQFIPFLQPQYNHATGALIGAEALVRWKKEEGFISPGEFIPIFEKNGFVYEVDKTIWEQVGALLRKWLNEGKKPLPVSVNISRVDLYKEDFMETICGLVKKYRLPTELLRLEVTESAFADAPQHITRMVNKLIQQGFTVEIDDFGSGYSSLNTLKDIPASILKLDMKFFSDTENGVRSGNIIESVVRMAKWLGMAIIAEGVEKPEQADYLKSIGCYYIQGYLYSRPIPVEEYEELLESNLHEKKLSRLKTVSTLDNEQFWNPESLETLIFNSFVGGACIFEQYKGRLEVLRVNDRYLQELGSILKEDYDLTTMRPADYMDKDNLFLLNETIAEAVTTKEEAFCELRLKNAEDKTEYIRYFIRLIATTQERNLIYCVVFNMTEQRMAEKKLVEAEQKEVESSQRLRVIMDNVNGGVSAILVNENGTSQFIFSNDRYYELYGYTKAQAMEEKLDVMQLILPEDFDNVMAKIRQLKKDRKPTLIDYRIRKRNGRIVLLRSNSSIMRMAEYGNEVITSVVMDITEKRALEEQLRAIVTNINGGVTVTVLHDGKPDFIIVNDQFFKILGYDTREQYNLTCKDKFDGIHPEDKERVIQTFITSAGGKKQYSMEYRIIRRDGEIRNIQNNVSVVKLFGIEEPVQLSVANDITELRKAQRSERILMEQLRTIMKNVNGGITATKLIGNGSIEVIFANEGFYHLFGYTKEELEKENTDILSLILPEDREKTMKTVARVVKNRGSETYEYRCHKKDGSIIWTQTTNTVVALEGVGDSVLLAVIMDVTELHNLREREAEVADKLNTIVNSVDNGITAVALHGDRTEFIMANDKFYEIHGLSKDKCPKLIEEIVKMVHVDDRTRVREAVYSAIHQHGTTNGEYRILRPNGEIVWVKATISITKIAGIEDPVQVTIYSDITEMKNQETQLQMDITEMKKKEGQLKVVEEEYRCAALHSGRTIGRYNIAKQTLTITTESAKRLELPECIEGVPEDRIRLGVISQGTAEAYRTFYDSIIKGDKEGTVIYQKLIKNDWHWISAHSTTIFSEKGEPVEAIISYLEVTEQHK